MESSNLNIKSYLLNNKGNILAVFNVIFALLKEQWKVYTDKKAVEAIKVCNEVMQRAYLDNLPKWISFRGLNLIHYKYLHTKNAIATRSQPRPTSLGLCDGNYTVSIQYRLPYRHTLYRILQEGEVLKKWDIHHY